MFIGFQKIECTPKHGGKSENGYAYKDAGLFFLKVKRGNQKLQKIKLCENCLGNMMQTQMWPAADKNHKGTY